MKRKVFFITFLAALMVMPVFADRRVPMAPLVMPNPASNALGGSHVAYTDSVFSLLVNPAAMMRVQERSFFTLSASLFNPQATSDISSAIMDMVADGDTSNIGNIADTLSRHEGMIALGAEFSGGFIPFHFAWVANGFGFGIWNRTFAQAEIIGDTVRATVFQDFMLPIGFAFRVLDMERHSIDAGFTLKPFIRIMTNQSMSITDLMDDVDFDASIPVILGGGLDFGLLYRWDGGFQAGITFSDILSRGTVVSNLTDVEDNNSYYIPFTVNLGVSHSFRLARIFGITLAADWRDIGNAFNQSDYLNNRNFLLDFGFGAQLSLFNTFFLRLGMSEMLPAAGIGVHLGIVQIDLAYHGREFGYEPGQLSTATVDLSIAIRPGARERNWAWTRGSVLGLFGVGN